MKDKKGKFVKNVDQLKKNNDDIHEFVDVSLEDYFNRKDFNIKFLAKVFDESTCSIKKKKKNTQKKRKIE